MTTANSTDQTNPEQCRHLGVDKGSKEGDRTVEVRASTPNPSDPLSYDRFITEKYVSPARDIFEEYTSFVLSIASQKTSESRFQQGIIGAATETGELLDALKKHMFQGRPIDVTNIKEECGDLWFYMTELMAAIGTNIFDIMKMNVAKLKQRYPDGFNIQKSVDRDTDQEREILEENRSKNSCEVCAATVCVRAGQEGTVCKKFKDNRNYPIVPISWREAEQITIDRKNPPQVFSDASPTAKVACCGNCAKRLTLEGCSRYVKTNNDGCCIDHKFL